MFKLSSFRRHEASSQPTSLYPAYRATVQRTPRQPLIFLPHTLSEVTGPVYGHNEVAATDHDLTRQHPGEPLGERIIVKGQVLDDDAFAQGFAGMLASQVMV